MRFTRFLTVVAAAAGLAVGGCGSGGEDDPVANTSAPATTAATASASAPPSPPPTAEAAAPTGTLTTAPVKCTQVKLPTGLARANAGPEVMCAFESDTDYVSFAVGTRMASTFDVAKAWSRRSSNGKIVIEPVPADGWTFGARWPDDGPFVRVQQWLVDGQKQVLLCKMGSDRGEAGIAELADVCEQAKTALYTR